jgi:glycosyltransferase involved in cell wall biosynthesis
LSFGRLAFEKRKIGDDVEALLAKKHLSLDISSRWEDRIGGAGWFQFLASCKATLGAESGASIFDLDGDLNSRCRRAEEELGAFRVDHDYAESYLSYLQDLEGNVYYNQISPRHFEAIATQTLQLLYPGTYSGIFQSGMHYFSLNRDYSNLQEGVDLLLNETKRTEITTRAYEEILLNEKYWIETFVQNVDDEISVALEKKNINARPSYKTSTVGTNVLLIAAHEPRIDPRLGWIANCAASPLKIHQCGVLPPHRENIIKETTPNGALYLAAPRLSYRHGLWVEWQRLVKGDPAGVAAVQEMLFLEQALSLPGLEFAELFAAPPECERLVQFRWYIRYFLDTSATLLRLCLEMRGIHAVIATDLDTLLPALVLKAVYKVPVFYDAHEYWAESDVNSFEFERSYWIALEKRLVTHADYRQIVSPGLAKLLGDQYHCTFDFLPNCEPLTSWHSFSNKSLEEVDKSKTCSFLFQGGFSRGRGLDLLINAWADTADQAILLLRGRDSEYKSEMIELAGKTGLLGSRIFFPEPVDEADMIRSASEADVGVAPYPPTNTLYAHCSPNKLSQYMAAGIPILANDTNFVRNVITEGRCGFVVDFSRVADLV